MEPKPAASSESSAEAPSPSLPVGPREYFAVGTMVLFFAITQFLAILLTPSFGTAEIRGFEDPTDWTNGLVLIGIILAFTALILFIARKRRMKLLQWLILGSVGITIAYVFYALLFGITLVGFPSLFTNVGTVIGLWLLALALAVVPTWLLYTFPEWYVVDLVGILVSAGAIAIFGTSFTPVTYLVVLVGTAIYDYVSVYKTKHMLTLADQVLEMHLPIMLVVPKSKGYSFLDERGGLREQADAPPSDEPKEARDAMFIGLGDVVIPSILIVSALTFSGAWSAVGALLGTLAGFLVLMTFVLKGRPQAGLPSLNGGAFLGFLIGYYLEFGTLQFW